MYRRFAWKGSRTPERTPPSRPRGRLLWAPVVLSVSVLSLGLLQAWLVQSRHAIAYEVRRLDAEIQRLEDEVDALHLRAEALRAPARVRALAEAGGYVLPADPPVLLPPRVDRNLTAALETPPKPSAPEEQTGGPLSAGFFLRLSPALGTSR